MTKIISSLKSDFFIKNLAFWSFIDVFYEKGSYEKSLAQLVSAGAFEAHCH